MSGNHSVRSQPGQPLKLPELSSACPSKHCKEGLRGQCGQGYRGHCRKVPMTASPPRYSARNGALSLTHGLLSIHGAGSGSIPCWSPTGYLCPDAGQWENRAGLVEEIVRRDRPRPNSCLTEGATCAATHRPTDLAGCLPS